MVSGDFRVHPVGVFLQSLLRNTDSASLEFYIYNNNPATDNLSALLKHHSAVWREIHTLSDRDAAECIAQDGIQILLDLSGHTAFNRLAVFAHKPAPIQVSWLGFFASSGVEQIDYVLVDELGVPLHNASEFIEKIAYLPHTRFCYGDYIADVAPDIMPAKNDTIVLGVFQKPSKFSDEVFQAWCDILHRLPLAVIRFHRPIYLDPQLCKFILGRFAHFGIDSKRIEFKSEHGYANYLEYYNHIDVVLDTYPFNGATTNFEALWMGVPILTWAGNQLASRQTLSILAMADLLPWVAYSRDEYSQIAVDMLSDRTKLQTYKNHIIQTVRHSRLFDGKAFSSDFARVMNNMWLNHPKNSPLQRSEKTGTHLQAPSAQH